MPTTNMTTELSLDEEYLVRLFRCLPGDNQNVALIELAKSAIRANLLPERPDGLSVDEQEDWDYDAIDKAIDTFQPSAEIVWKVDDWWHKILEDLFADEKAEYLLGTRSGLEGSSDLLVQIIEEYDALDYLPHFYSKGDAEISREFLPEWRALIIEAMEKKTEQRIKDTTWFDCPEEEYWVVEMLTGFIARAIVNNKHSTLDMNLLKKMLEALEKFPVIPKWDIDVDFYIADKECGIHINDSFLFIDRGDSSLRYYIDHSHLLVNSVQIEGDEKTENLKKNIPLFNCIAESGTELSIEDYASDD